MTGDKFGGLDSFDRDIEANVLKDMAMATWARQLVSELTGGTRPDGAKMPAIGKLIDEIKGGHTRLTEDEAWEACEVLKILKRYPR